MRVRSNERGGRARLKSVADERAEASCSASIALLPQSVAWSWGWWGAAAVVERALHGLKAWEAVLCAGGAGAHALDAVLAAAPYATTAYHAPWCTPETAAAANRTDKNPPFPALWLCVHRAVVRTMQASWTRQLQRHKQRAWATCSSPTPTPSTRVSPASCSLRSLEQVCPLILRTFSVPNTPPFFSGPALSSAF